MTWGWHALGTEALGDANLPAAPHLASAAGVATESFLGDGGTVVLPFSLSSSPLCSTIMAGCADSCPQVGDGDFVAMDGEAHGRERETKATTSKTSASRTSRKKTSSARL